MVILLWEVQLSSKYGGARNVDQCCIGIAMMEREKLRGLLAWLVAELDESG